MDYSTTTTNRKQRNKRLNESKKLARVTGHRVGDCLGSMVASTGRFQLNKVTGRARLTGLVTCGSVWDCPVCSARIAYIRQQEIQAGLEYWFSQGYQALFVTYTIRHNTKDKLNDLARVITEGIRFVKSGRSYQELKKELGIEGSITLTEVTRGTAGWHFHKHIIILYKNKLNNLRPDDNYGNLYDVLVCKYRDYIEGQGYSIIDRVGVDIQQVTVNNLSDIALYVTKWGITQEITSTGKVAKGGLSPFQLLDDINTYGDLFIEYSLAMYGKRRITFSRGLRELLGLGEDKSDEELLTADDNNSEDYEDILVISSDLYKIILKHDLLPDLLDTLEKDIYLFLHKVLKLINKDFEFDDDMIIYDRVK